MKRAIHTLAIGMIDNMIGLVAASKSAILSLEGGPQMGRRLENVADFLVGARVSLDAELTEEVLAKTDNQITEARNELAQCWETVNLLTRKILVADETAEMPKAFFLLDAAVHHYDGFHRILESLADVHRMDAGVPQPEREKWVERAKMTDRMEGMPPQIELLEHLFKRLHRGPSPDRPDTNPE